MVYAGALRGTGNMRFPLLMNRRLTQKTVSVTVARLTNYAPHPRLLLIFWDDFFSESLSIIQVSNESLPSSRSGR